MIPASTPSPMRVNPTHVLTFVATSSLHRSAVLRKPVCL
jgi:hypothetical protein